MPTTSRAFFGYASAEMKGQPMRLFFLDEDFSIFYRTSST